MYEGHSYHSTYKENEYKKEAEQYRNKFEKLQSRISSIGTRIGLTDVAFNDLFDLMIDSDDQIVIDIFEQMLIAGKILFSEELNQVEILRRKFREEMLRMQQIRIQIYEESQKKREKAEEAYTRIQEKSKIIVKKRRDLLLDLRIYKIRYNAISSVSVRKDVDELIESNHLRISMFGYLKVVSAENIPTSKIMKKELEKTKPSDWMFDF